jgi:DNA-directed RNA polymerase specialized sigma24 family protein
MGDREIDQQLVERAQRGDKRAFELLVAKYQRKLGRLLSRFVRDAAEVEDVTQEAFIKAYRALPQFPGRERLLHVALPDRHQHAQELPRRAGRRRPRPPASTTRKPRASRTPSSCAT